MRGLIESSAKSLTQARMIRFIEHTGTLHSTDLGRTASHYYINAASIEVEYINFSNPEKVFEDKQFLSGQTKNLKVTGKMFWRAGKFLSGQIKFYSYW